MIKINKSHRYLLAVAGVFGTVFGIVMVVPSILKESYIAASLFATLMVIGIVLLAIAFGD